MATPGTIESRHLPTIALVGRVNVGKSTLFNRLIEQNKAIVSNIPGTTRTSNEGLVLWRGKQFQLTDTGGLTFDENIPLEAEVILQTKISIEKADMIVFVTDGCVGLLPQERELAKILKNKPDKPILLAINKVDSTKIENQINTDDWKRLGFGTPFLISATNGRNLGDFLDLIFHNLNKLHKRPKNHQDQTGQIINVGIIGKPNAGKSSLFNKLIGEEKVIVSPIPHTTREPHDTLMTYSYEIEGKKKEQLLNFVDTAGIRRKSRVEGELERAGIQKSLEAIEKSHIVLFIVDGSEPISTQDKQLGGLLERHSKSVLILINKWDLAKDNTDSARNTVKEKIYAHFPHLKFAPIVFVSGLSGYRTHQIFPLLMQAWQARHTEISSTTLDIFLKNTIKRHLPSIGKGVRHPELLGFHQINSNPPIFELFIKPRTSVNVSYVHFMENRLREEYGFFATPIVIKLRKVKK